MEAVLPSLCQPGNRLRFKWEIPNAVKVDFIGLVHRYITLLQYRSSNPVDVEAASFDALVTEKWNLLAGSGKTGHMRTIHAEAFKTAQTLVPEVPRETRSVPKTNA